MQFQGTLGEPFNVKVNEIHEDLDDVDWTGLGWAGLGWAWLGWAGLGWAGLRFAMLGDAGLGYTRQGQAGLACACMVVSFSSKRIWHAVTT